MTRAIAILLILASAGTVAGSEEPADPALYEHERGPHLVGAVDRQDIAEHFPDWDAEYADYEPLPEAVAELAAVDAPVDIVCVLGTWCHDSEREVPRLWKILDAADNEVLALQMLAVGRAGDEGARAVEAELGIENPLREVWDVEFVPTFVFLRDGRELGRIIETPETTLEEDAAALLAAPVAPNAPTWH